MFQGQGTLHYPNGSKVKGRWDHGRMVERTYVFPDGIEYEDNKFEYCKKPDRRYLMSILKKEKYRIKSIYL